MCKLFPEMSLKIPLYGTNDNSEPTSMFKCKKGHRVVDLTHAVNVQWIGPRGLTYAINWSIPQIDLHSERAPIVVGIQHQCLGAKRFPFTKFGPHHWCYFTFCTWNIVVWYLPPLLIVHWIMQFAVWTNLLCGSIHCIFAVWVNFAA